MPELDQGTAAKATAIRAGLNGQLDDLRSNGDITDVARLQRIAKAYTDAKGEMNALEQSFSGGATKSVESLTQQVFGATNVTGVEAISARDAGDRAAQLNSGAEGLELLRRTESNGDKVLARAIALRAFEARRDFFNGSEWAPVLDRYTETHPGVADKMLEIEQAQQSNVSLASYFAFILPKPTELERYSDYAIQGLIA